MLPDDISDSSPNDEPQLSMQGEPSSPRTFLPMALVAIGALGLAYSVLGGGRKAIDYVLGATVLFAAGFLGTMVVAALGRLLVDFVQFFIAMKNRRS